MSAPAVTRDGAVRAAFELVADLGPDERRARLDALGLDAGQRAEVERLLARDRAMGEAEPAGPAPVRVLLERAFESPIDAALPARIGRYRVTRRVSTGGMGAVFECEAPGGGVVAVKTLNPALCSPDAVRRFEHEAEALSRLDDPNVARLLDFGMADLGLGEQPFIAMEYVRGETLDAHVARVRPGRRELAAMMSRLARAVHRVHLRGVVHRDLKPGNVLVTEDGVPKIVDFGVALVGGPGAEAVTSLTLAGQLPGTLEYMSPEQAAGGEVDARADVYALGAVWYAMMTGRPPVAVAGLGVGRAIGAIAREEPARPRSINPALPRDAERVVLHALAKDPADRYQSAAALADDLDRLVRGDAVSVRSPGALVRAARWSRRHPGRARALAGVALALAVFGAAAGVLGVRASDAERRAREWEGTSVEAFEVLEQLLVAFSRNRLGPNASARDLVDTIADDLDRLATTPEASARATSQVAYAYFVLEDYATALVWFDRSVGEAEALHGPGSPEAIRELYRLSLTRCALGDAAGALATADEAIARSAPGESWLASLHLARGTALMRTERYAEALAAFEASRARALEVSGPDHPRHIKALLDIAVAQVALGEPGRAVGVLEEVIERNRKIRSETHAREWRANIALGEAHHAIGELEASTDAYEAALHVLELTHEPTHPATAYARAGLARTLIDRGEAARAAAILREVVRARPAPWWLGIRTPADYEADLSRAEAALRAG